MANGSVAYRGWKKSRYCFKASGFSRRLSERRTAPDNSAGMEDGETSGYATRLKINYDMDSWWISGKATVTSCAKRCLSCGGLPRSAGYSKSRSRPSNWRSRRNSMLVWMNSERLDASRSIDVILATPKFQPPTARSVFTPGWRCLTSLNIAYLSNNTGKFKPPTVSSVFTPGWRRLTSLNIAYLSNNTGKFKPPTVSSVFTPVWRYLTSLNIAYLSPSSGEQSQSVDTITET